MMVINNFKLKNLGKLNYFLGSEIERSTKRFSLYQWMYALEFLDDASFFDCNHLNVPLNEIKLSNRNGDLFHDPT